MNERITEDFVRNHFKTDPLYKVIKLEEQKSSSLRIKDLLQTASKKGTGIGKPEFIITFPLQNSNYIIIVECKSNIANHTSTTLDKPKDFAVDGVLHYAKYLRKYYNVLCIAVSGQNTNEFIVSTLLWNKEHDNFIDLNVNKLLSINDYLKLFNNEVFSENIKYIDIVQKAVYLNNQFQSYSITEFERCTIVSAILLGLLDNTFKKAYTTYENSQDLADDLIISLKRVLKNYKVRNTDSILGEFQKITNEPLFKLVKLKLDKEEKLTISIIKEFIEYLYQNVYPLMKMDDAGLDVLGKFYTEFIRYAGSSKKQGLVLTPNHVTEFFCDLASINKDSIVYDPCCGSGGFLIAAMKKMLNFAEFDNDKKSYIKNHQLIGVERRASMFTYACSNMMLRGDGKSNIYHDDCFNLEKQIIQAHKPNVVFLNPPYDVGTAAQMEFIEHGLRIVSSTNGVVVAIVQMSCALGDDKEILAVKKRLINKHRLKAVISMPDELFNPASSVPTCIMVWEANKSHNNYETWFGYLKDDGFEKRKGKGRIDAKKRWNIIKDNFLKLYYNQKEKPGVSVKKHVDFNDEWCAEAYMETDYSNLTITNFENVVKSFYAFKYIYQDEEIE